ncbi:MAG: GrdX family protein [Clostridia bacterium]|nr:GrdX family protein [Clostridia bacterium]
MRALLRTNGAGRIKAWIGGETVQKKYQLVTNNESAMKAYANHPHIGVTYLARGSYLDVLITVRDRVHEGWHLMTHPQASNLKPNQCPYKTVLIANGREVQSFARDVELIEGSIAAFHKFTDGMRPPAWSQKALRDFQTVDLAVVESAVNGSLLRQMISGNI